jgi:predicted NBD/HSP70 family sugar kinase
VTFSVVFDIGGTNLRAALYEVERDYLSQRQCLPTPNYLTFPQYKFEELVQLLLKDLDSILEHVGGDDNSPVSLAFPGPIGPGGFVLAAPTIWGSSQVQPFPLLDILKSKWSPRRAFLLNDVAAAGYAYVSPSTSDFCVVTVSSGIGSKVFLQGSPVLGAHGLGGEIGHIRVDVSTSAIKCDCGATGHLATVASGRGTLSRIRAAATDDEPRWRSSMLGYLSRSTPERLQTEHIVSAFHAGDEWVSRFIRDGAEALGRTLATIGQSVGVHEFILVGGFAKALGSHYVAIVADEINEALAGFIETSVPRVYLGSSADDSGLRGAGRFAARQ